MIKAIICLAPMPTLGFPTFRLEKNKPTDQRIMNEDELSEHPSIKYIEKIIQENNIKQMIKIYKKANFNNGCPVC